MRNYFLLLLLASLSGFCQTINDYQYAVVPARFEFQKENDQYKLNTYTKMFMEKYGFKAYLDSEVLPDEIAQNMCNRVLVEVSENNSLMQRKLSVVVKDCKNNILYTGQGSSKEKEFKVAYVQALREAFNGFEFLGYAYNGTKPEVKPAVKPAVTTAVTETVVIREDFEKSAATPAISAPITGNTTITANAIANGFELRSGSKTVMTLLKSSAGNVYIASRGAQQGVVMGRNGQWFFEYYENGQFFSEQLHVTGGIPQ